MRFFFSGLVWTCRACDFDFFASKILILVQWDRCGRKGSVFELECSNTYTFRYEVTGFDMLTSLRNKLPNL
jgi:hypothetical protein